MSSGAPRTGSGLVVTAAQWSACGPPARAAPTGAHGRHVAAPREPGEGFLGTSGEGPPGATGRARGRPSPVPVNRGRVRRRGWVSVLDEPAEPPGQRPAPPRLLGRDHVEHQPARAESTFAQRVFWGAILPHRESSTVGGLQRASTVLPSGLSPFGPCFSGAFARCGVADERPRCSRRERACLVRDPRRGALGIDLGSRGPRDAPRRLRGA